MQFLGLLVIGLVIGVGARMLRPGPQDLNLGWTFGLGLAGALVGGLVASSLGTGDVLELNVLGTLVGVATAVLLVGAAEGLVGRRKG
ncbi:GlsB/YeaQ/YmgE family stress response membrane protein [Nocardioides stalactiti]|uniref:GlsB/YeaQ/YmgE family stress response membrane protein n=1 Tax=Nocardioides stalactiti TaxID=2755356 RepID=UPI0016009310|nr:hypothetical protein [Nocardioides stalactiti]